jgi:hypothetical protein
MKVQGAVIKEQGVAFAIVVVKRSVFNSKKNCEDAQESFSSLFPGMPIVLMAQNVRGRPKYWGRKDIVNFLANIRISQIPWKEYTFR